SAQVLGVRDLGNQQFSLQLRLQLPNGQQVNMQAQSNQPASVGQNLVMTALGGQTFSLSAAGPAAVMQLTRFDPAQYPAGSQIQARVLQVEARPQGNFQITLTLNNGARTGDHFTVESPKALAVNSLISARVNGSFELSLIPAGQNFRQLAVQQELGGQFVRQGSPAAVLQQLMQLTGEGAAALDKLPSDSQKLIQQLLGSLPELGGKLSGPQLAELIKNSGILLESRLHADAASQQDIKANLLRLIAQILPQQAHANPLGAATQAGLTSQALPQLLRELGGPAASLREQALRFPVTSRILEKLDNPNDLGSLLRLAAAAISRLQTHQLSSLAQTYTTQDGTQVTTWQTEVPMRDQANVVPLQVRFQQEQHNPADEQNQQPPVWRLELSFDIDPLGPMHVQVNLQEDNLSSLLWAERERTASLVSKELHVLRDKLLAAGLNIRELDCRQGIPPAAPKALIEQRWIDDLA
ncbi:MAG: flagellar hook-length control protein FliK, partial [Thiopseudomonas sp.]